MPGFISEETMEEILSKADIESVVGRYVSFNKRSGNNLFGLCPFHSEKTGSFSINPAKGIYYCFGCHKGGNSINFIAEMERVGYYDAARILAEQYGITIPETSSSNNDFEKRKKDRVYEILTKSAAFFYKNLYTREGEGARKYAEKRNLSASTLKKFGIGYAPDSWDSLYKYLVGLGFNDDELNKSGLFTVSKKTGRLIDLFRGRLIFPIFDSFGKVIAFGGRAMGDEMPKYVNSPDSLVYKKQNHLYGLNFAKKDRSGQLIICEGYMDAIAMHQAGINNAVASLGTAFTDAQLRLVSKYAEEVVFFFDADNAGQAASLRAIKMMLGYLKTLSGVNIRIKIAVVPDAKDPDEYIREYGKDSFLNVVKSARDVDVYLFDRAYNDSFIDDKLDLGKYQELIIEYGSWITDEIKRYRMAADANIYLKATQEVLVSKMVEREARNAKDIDLTNKRQIEKDEKEEIRRRSESSEVVSSSDVSPKPETINQEKKKGISIDYANENEMMILVYAALLKENLADPSCIKTTDIFRPDDFLGDNMKKCAECFFNCYKPESGLIESMFIGELSSLIINGNKAEIAYLSAAANVEETKNIMLIRGKYLTSLYAQRKMILKGKRNFLVKKLVSETDSEKKTKYENALKKIDAGLEYLKEEEKKI